MIGHETLLVTLVKLVGRIPVPPPAARGRGRPPLYPDRLFLQALVMMIVRHLHTVHTLLSVLAQPTSEMQALRALLTVDGRFPTCRTWERRLQAVPMTLPAQIGCLGRALVAMIRPWASCGRAAAIDSTVLRARGGVWHKKDREAGIVPHTSIDTEAHWTKSGWHGWVYGWKLHLVMTVADVWIPLAADLTPANVADNEQALTLLPELPAEVRYVLGDQHHDDPAIDAACGQAGRTVVATHRGPYPPTRTPESVCAGCCTNCVRERLRTCMSHSRGSLTRTARSRPRSCAIPAALSWVRCSSINSPSGSGTSTGWNSVSDYNRSLKQLKRFMTRPQLGGLLGLSD
jgi:hypothetical protein